jgi:hypothetical protein
MSNQYEREYFTGKVKLLVVMLEGPTWEVRGLAIVNSISARRLAVPARKSTPNGVARRAALLSGRKVPSKGDGRIGRQNNSSRISRAKTQRRREESRNHRDCRKGATVAIVSIAYGDRLANRKSLGVSEGMRPISLPDWIA